MIAGHRGDARVTELPAQDPGPASRRATIETRLAELQALRIRAERV